MVWLGLVLLLLLATGAAAAAAADRLNIVCIGCGGDNLVVRGLAQELLASNPEYMLFTTTHNTHTSTHPSERLGQAVLPDAANYTQMRAFLAHARAFFSSSSHSNAKEELISTIIWAPNTTVEVPPRVEEEDPEDPENEPEYVEDALGRGALYMMGSQRTARVLQEQIAANVHGLLHLVTLLERDLVHCGEFSNQSASIVALSSFVAKQPVLGEFATGMAKLALEHAVSSIAQEMGAFGVRANTVRAAVIDYEEDKDGTTLVNRRWAHRHRVGRVGVPQDLAGVIALLVSPSKAGFITGQVFDVDGGHALLASLHDYSAKYADRHDERYTPVASKWRRRTQATDNDDDEVIAAADKAEEGGDEEEEGRVDRPQTGRDAVWDEL